MEKQFVIKVLPYGYYAGPNKKYGDMFDCSTKEFAERFNSTEEIEGITKMLDRAGYHAGYDYFIEELKDESK